ncbi:hypothetical protein HanHA300_Chr09g0336741 [Helianthus annuus]|nr:hypothetical protein HanHA300_Chr09g0336741 [Helianthus annuus]KAJ0536456.1 hypothetical protein HanIR_Chr09g0441841 [Helianthus annuus]KAJ0544096.1 hypothetical protein HanHA89_Chr09g0357821 [Helianthus annuus]
MVLHFCRYLAEALVQAMQFDEADTLCKRTLEIHRIHSAPASLEEAADRRLMALICFAADITDRLQRHRKVVGL